MLTPSYTNQFKKDLKKYKKDKKKTDKLKLVMTKLINEKILADKYKDHKLKGNYKDRRECHIFPDMLLIYKLIEDQIIFERIGSHSDLFK